MDPVSEPAGEPVDDTPIYAARALVLADLQARALATADAVTVLEEVCSERRWWLEQWAEGAPYVPGLIAQDLQENLADRFGRHDPQGLWPVCTACDDGPVHTLHVEPDLGGPDPHWICEESGRVIAALGALATA